ncbi:MAG: ComEC/Rec2 family competence protein [Sphingobacteriales bacterium]|nr:ComEC/Rec2 family competence protein [Sphingobacteriales bacterium]
MYAETGTIHLLAVSGLHILLIGNTLYVFFVWLLRRWRKGKQTALVMAIACVVLYTLLSGLSVSAVRAALMYAMVGVGQLLGRRIITLNIVAATAFILLIFNPLSLYNIGFQLSYSAVLGIIWLNPYIQNWWISRHYWADMIWNSISVTLAASIATLPLLIYYFHQFPLYFVISNLVAVPADILLKLGLLLLAVAAIEPLGYALGVLVQQLINVMNGMLGIIQHLPGALWQPLPLSAGEAVVLYACIAGFTMFFINKHVSFLKFALLMLFILSASSFKRAFTLSQHIIVYHISKHSAIEFEHNRQVYLCRDSTLAHDAAALNFNISPRFKQERLTKTDTLLLEYDYSDERILRQSPLLVAGIHLFCCWAAPKIYPIRWVIGSRHGRIARKNNGKGATDFTTACSRYSDYRRWLGGVVRGSTAEKTFPQLYATAERVHTATKYKHINNKTANNEKASNVYSFLCTAPLAFLKIFFTKRLFYFSKVENSLCCAQCFLFR